MHVFCDVLCALARRLRNVAQCSPVVSLWDHLYAGLSGFVRIFLCFLYRDPKNTCMSAILGAIWEHH